MAIKELAMANIVCHRNNLDELIRDLILTGKCQFVDTFLEINEGEFNIDISREHADEILDMEDIVPLKENKEVKVYIKKFEETLKGMNYKPKIELRYTYGNHNFEIIKREIDKICNDYEEFTDEVHKLTDMIEKLEKLKHLEYMRDIDTNIDELVNLNHFTMKIGYLSREKARKIAQNYENIKAIVLHIGSYEEKEVYIVLTPKNLDTEMGRILRSVNFVEIKIPNEYLGTPNFMFKKIKEDMETFKDRLERIKEELKKEVVDESGIIDTIYSKLMMENKINQIKVKVAATSKFAYLSAWVPMERSKTFKEVYEGYPDLLVSYKASEEVSQSIPIPTRMENNFFFKPFETLVNMYGTPSHNEIDPTVFFGIAYVFLFGAMFGDLGQGMVITLSGILLKKRINPSFCGILSRIGIGSMFFGVIYDSFFGYEEIISKIFPKLIFIRPIDNINLILILAIVAGIVLIYISYIYSIINKLKIGDIEEGVFGRNGINGLFLLTFLLIGALEIAGIVKLIPSWILIIFILITVILLIMKQPFGNYLLNKEQLYEEDKVSYFVESGFNIFETFLSLLSNSASFIRVGAFALNHVGLFIAFHTLAGIIGGVGGNILMFFLGNIIIIGLEGLIVFIQGLRLFYYELFSKYYSGDGILFIPDEI